MGLRIRDAAAADSFGIARVHVDSWRSTYAGIVPQPALDALSHVDRETRWAQLLRVLPSDQCVFVAEDQAHGIVGFSSGGPRRTGPPDYAAELYAIYILETYQRRGLGRALVARVVDRLLRRGMTSMLVWVLAGNPACRFYQALGGSVVGAQPISIGDALLEEVAYGWKDIASVEQICTGERE